MEKRSPERLFLLEFLVDKVNLKEHEEKRFETKKYGSLLITVKIETFLCLDINQDALKKEETHFGTIWHFCCGKSCTFAMQPRKLLVLLKDLPCYFIIGMLDNRDMTSEVIGACKANLCNDLSDVILKAEIKRDKYPITSAIHQDTYNLRSPLGEDIGFLSIIVRLTSYGQAVFTHFTRVVGDNKVYLYENKDPDPCAVKDSDEETQGESLTFTNSIDALHIFKEADRHKYVCQFDRDKRTESYTNVHEKISTMHKPLQLQERTSLSTNPNVSKPADDQNITIVCTNISEILPESTFQRRFPDDTVPVAPLVSKSEDDGDPECTCLRDVQLTEMCRTMFLCDRRFSQVESGNFIQSKNGVYHLSNPPVRYNTTSCLTAAYGGHRPVPLNTLVVVEDEKKDLPNPPVRYDTTGALSPAFQEADAAPTTEESSLYLSSTGEFEDEETDLLCSPVQYGTSSVKCRCWCTCFTQISEGAPNAGVYHPSNPPVRYDTTSSLTTAFGGNRPVPLNSLVEIDDEKKDLPNPSVRYDTTGALSPAYQGASGGGGGGGGSGDDSAAVEFVEKHGKGIGHAICGDTRFVIPVPSVAFPNVMIVPWKKNRRYFYEFGDKHPGCKTGHSQCIPEFIKVPIEVGWLWKLYSLPGWKPGALNKTLKSIFGKVRVAAGMDIGKYAPRRKRKVSKSKSGSSTKKTLQKSKSKEEGETPRKVISKISPVKSKGKKKKSKTELSETESVELPPTLHIHEQNGNYYIAMQPVNLYPENVNVPLQFRIPIPKSKQDQVEQSETGSELRLDYQAPAVYWPAKLKTNALEIQCDSSEFSPSPPVEVLMEPKKKRGVKGKQARGSNVNANSQIVSWDKDPATAIGKVR